jgi:hypothetical protein
LTFAAVGLAACFSSPAAIAKQRCLPGSDDPQYCEHDPGAGNNHERHGGGDERGERQNRQSFRHHGRRYDVVSRTSGISS